MDDNRDPTGVLHQEISSLPVSIVTKFSNLQLPVEAV